MYKIHALPSLPTRGPMDMLGTNALCKQGNATFTLLATNGGKGPHTISITQLLDVLLCYDYYYNYYCNVSTGMGNGELKAGVQKGRKGRGKVASSTFIFQSVIITPAQKTHTT